MTTVYTLTEDSIRAIAADHRKLSQQVSNLRRIAESHLATPYTMPSQIVQVWHDSATTFNVVEANADGLHKARIIRPAGDDGRTLQGTTATDYEECWLLFVDDYDVVAGDVLAVQGAYYGPARANGVTLSESSLLPLYTVFGCKKSALGKLDEALLEGGSATVSIYRYDVVSGWTDTLVNVEAIDFFLGPGESWLTSTRVKIDWEENTWVVTQASCSPDSGGGGGGSGSGSSSPATIGAGAGASMSGSFYPGGSDFGEEENVFGELQGFDSNFGD